MGIRFIRSRSLRMYMRRVHCILVRWPSGQPGPGTHTTPSVDSLPPHQSQLCVLGASAPPLSQSPSAWGAGLTLPRSPSAWGAGPPRERHSLEPGGGTMRRGSCDGKNSIGCGHCGHRHCVDRHCQQSWLHDHSLTPTKFDLSSSEY